MSVGRFQLALRALNLRAPPCPRASLAAARGATSWLLTPPWLYALIAAGLLALTPPDPPAL